MKNKHLHGARIFLLIFFITGAVGLALDLSRPLFLKLVPWSLLTSYLFLLFFHKGDRSLRLLLILAAVAVAGLALEIAGVYTGLIFGHYNYGETLGVKAFGVPVLIGTNWMMLTYCAHIIVDGLKMPPVGKVSLGALLMTAYDWLMEPAAMMLGMWDWAGGHIPVQNYLAWFIISWAFLMALRLGRIRYRNALAGFIFVLQAGFFALYQILERLLP